MVAQALSVALSSALIGGIAGALGALLMFLIDWVTKLGWGADVLMGFPSGSPVALQLLIPVLVGVIIGALRLRGAEPLPELHSTLEELHHQSSIKIQIKSSHLLLGLLALIGGGTIGPEALLSRAVAEWSVGLSRWRWLKNLPHRASCSVSGVLGLFGLPLIGGIALAERPERPMPSSLWRWLPGISSGIAGFAAFQGLTRFGSGELGVPYVWPSDSQQLLVHLFWALVLGLLGGSIGLIFLHWRKICEAGLQRRLPNPFSQAILTGIVIGIISQLQPLALFSGEQQITPMLQKEFAIGASGFILLGILKLASCGLCLSSGWVGGLFFPLIFSACSIAQGLALGWPDLIPEQVATSSMAAAIQSAVLGQALLPILITAGVLKGHAMGGAMVGSVVGLGLRQISLPRSSD